MSSPMLSRGGLRRDHLGWVRVVLALGALCYALVFIQAMLVGNWDPRNRVQEVCAALLLAIAYGTSRWRPRTAAWIGLGVAWVEITVSIVLNEGLAIGSLVTYPVVVAISGLILGGGVAIRLALLSGASLPIAVAMNGLLQRGALTPLTDPYWHGVLISFLATLVMGLVSKRSLEGYETLLEESERARARFRELFFRAPEALLNIDHNDTIIDANEHAHRLLADAGRSLVGTSFRAIRERLDGPIVTDEFQTGAPVSRRLDGKRIVEAAIRGGGGTETIISLRDVTERHIVEEQLSRSRRVEALGYLAGGVAHDFNNLLTTVSAGASALECRDDPLSREVARDLHEAHSRGAALTRQLLAFARSEPKPSGPIEIGEVLRGMTRLVEKLVGEQLVVEIIQDGPAWTKAERSELEQILLNLLSNARDASHLGGTITVRVSSSTTAEARGLGSTSRATRQAMIEVRDRGAGMAREVRDRIFEPFFTTKARGRGTGLGLSTVFAIVERCGGSIFVDSEVERGTTFRVFLPEQEGHTVEVAREESLGLFDGIAPRILFVEDDDLVARSALRALEEIECRVAHASDGAAALDLFEREGPFDLLLTDVVMPGMSGPELAKRIRERAPQLPVLFVSGYFDPAAEVEGAVPITEENLLRKPFTVSELLSQVRAVMRNAPSPREAAH